jgi:BirA family biotin operon repressor/biotin-[acetyl-CoA-carboxylase] ligase
MNQGFDRQRFLAAGRVVRQCSASILPFLSRAEGQERLNQDDACSTGMNQRLHVFESVASTNQTAWELMGQGNLDPIVLALSQTAGRGQWGRQWQSEKGGLYLSVGLQLGIPVADAAELTLCTAWGIAMALRTIPAQLSGVAGGIPVQLKWLNDLVLKGHKLGGILTETRIQQQQITQAVIGVGLNWTNAVPETGITLQSFLAQHPTPLIESLEMLTAIALHGIWGGMHYQQTGQMETVRRDYLDLLAHRDRPIQWAGTEWAIVGIDPSGALRVRSKFPETPIYSIDQATSTPEVLIQPGTINLGYPL